MKRFKLIFPLLVLLLLVTTRCTKEKLTETSSIETQEEFLVDNIQDPIIKNFLTTSYVSSVNENVLPKLKSRNDEELIDDVIDALNEQNKQHNFIKNLSKKFGYPIWDRSYIYESSNNDRLILFTPLAFEDGDEITSFIVAVPQNDSYHIELFTKKKIDNLIKNPNKANDNLIFTVMFCIIADLDIFDNAREEYVEWFNENKDSFTGGDDEASSRGCTDDVICASEPVALTSDTEIASSRGIVCITIVTCDTGGGDSSCQECGGGGGTGGVSGGGGSGSGSAYPTLESNLTTEQFNTLKSYNLNSNEMNLLEDLFERGMFEENLNECEKSLIVSSPNHAVCATTIYANSLTANTTERRIFGSNTVNGCGDAFRHAHWNALNTKTCGAGMAQEFGDAHECDSPASSGRTMDLNNNQIGRQIGMDNINLPHSGFGAKVCDALGNGLLSVLSNTSNVNSRIVSSTRCSCN